MINLIMMIVYDKRNFINKTLRITLLNSAAAPSSVAGASNQATFNKSAHLRTRPPRRAETTRTGT